MGLIVVLLSVVGAGTLSGATGSASATFGAGLLSDIAGFSLTSKGLHVFVASVFTTGGSHACAE